VETDTIEEDGAVDDSHFEVTTEGSGLYRVVGAKIEKVPATMNICGTIFQPILKLGCV
jgi:hypothetical protein